MKGHILIVDDQPGIRLLLTDVLTSEGYVVFKAKTGQEALDKIYQHSFDLIILDDHLPILSGQEVLQQMTDDQLHIPVIMMSGLIEDLEKRVTKYDMVIETIAKPFNIKDVCTLVNGTLLDQVL